MRSLPIQLREFHICYDLDPEASSHLTCIEEEMDELQVEIDADPIGEGAPCHSLAKEAIDVVYTIVSLFVAQGWDFEAAFEEVHRSNMSKLSLDRLPLRRADGKILKGPNYREADLTKALSGGRQA